MQYENSDLHQTRGEFLIHVSPKIKQARTSRTFRLTQPDYRVDRPAHSNEERDWLSSAVNQSVFPAEADVDWHTH